MDQPVHRDHARELSCSLGQSLLFQYLVQTNTPPELVTDMNSSGFAMEFGGDQFWIDGNTSAIV
jgi:hypothetical protein